MRCQGPCNLLQKVSKHALFEDEQACSQLFRDFPYKMPVENQYFCTINVKSMYQQIIIPTAKNHIIELPASLYGKKVKVTIDEVVSETGDETLPVSLKHTSFWNDVPFNPEFPSAESIRERAWPKTDL